MCERVIVTDFNAYAGRIFVRQALEQFLVLRLPVAQRHEREVLFQQLRGDVRDQVESFLIHESRDDSQQWPLEILFP